MHFESGVFITYGNELFDVIWNYIVLASTSGIALNKAAKFKMKFTTEALGLSEVSKVICQN